MLTPRFPLLALLLAIVLMSAGKAGAQSLTLREVKQTGDKIHVHVSLPTPATPIRLTLLLSLMGEPAPAQQRMFVAFRLGGFVNDKVRQLSPTEFLIPATIPEGLAAGVYQLTEIAVESGAAGNRTYTGDALPRFSLQVESTKVEDRPRTVHKPVEEPR